MDNTIQQLAQEGAMTFLAFMAAARANGENPALWLREKHQGRIETYFDNGTHMVRVPQPAAQEA